jgi:CheY-like chemotaxis protein
MCTESAIFAQKGSFGAIARHAILMVDDNPVNLKPVRVLLAGEGYDVLTAADAEEAMRLLRAARSRIILMEVRLPGIDSLEPTRRLQADAGTRDITILSLTAHAMQGDEEKIMAAGCDGYIAKPIDTRALPTVIRRDLEN